MRLRARPTVYEINTAVWLQRLGRERGRPLGLGEVPGCEWDVLAALPVDALWLMGVWQRSAAGRAVAVAEPGLFAGYRAALPDVRDDDVIGSPYCVSGGVQLQHVVSTTHENMMFANHALKAGAIGLFAKTSRIWSCPMRCGPLLAVCSTEARI